MPKEGGKEDDREDGQEDGRAGHATDDNVIDEVSEEDWRRANILLQSCTKDEMLSDDLNSHDILIRLFHEEGVRVFEPIKVAHKCRCSAARVQNVYDMLSDEEKRDVVVDGNVEMTCDFCSKTYEIDADE